MNRFAGLISLFIGIMAVTFSHAGFAQSTSFISDHGIAYDLQGEGDTIVFIHGSNLDRRMWAGQLEYFSESGRALAFDLRGLGSSEVPTQPYSDAEDLALLLEKLGASNPVIVGLSAGAQVALDFALSKPGYVRKLILVSPSLNGYAPKENPTYLTQLVSALREQDYELANSVLLESELMSVSAEYSDLVQDMVNSSRQWHLSYELIQQSVEPVISNLSKIEVSTLILIGADDVSAIKEIGNYVQRELPNAKLISVAGGHHLLNLSNPSQFNGVVSEFLESGKE